MMSSSFYYVGIFLSHGFAQPLYFQGKYGLSIAQIGLITGFHRLSLALPLFVTGTFMHKVNVKKALIIAGIVVTVFLGAMGFINNILIAVPVSSFIYLVIW